MPEVTESTDGFRPLASGLALLKGGFSRRESAEYQADKNEGRRSISLTQLLDSGR
jgi:hypothetical protein